MQACYNTGTLPQPHSNMKDELDHNIHSNATSAVVKKNYDCSSLPPSCTLSTLSLSMSPSYNDIGELDGIEELDGIDRNGDDTLYGENEPNVIECENNAYQSTWITAESDDSFWTDEMELLLTLKHANPVYDSDSE